MRTSDLFKFWLIQLFIIFAALLFNPYVAIAEPATEPLKTVQIDYKSKWIYEMGSCESNNNPSIVHLDSNGQYSYGELQFQMGTWLTYSDKFGTTPENIHDSELQYMVARYILDNGGSWNWKTCAEKTTNKLGQYPL